MNKEKKQLLLGFLDWVEEKKDECGQKFYRSGCVVCPNNTGGKRAKSSIILLLDFLLNKEQKYNFFQLYRNIARSSFHEKDAMYYIKKDEFYYVAKKLFEKCITFQDFKEIIEKL